MHRDLIIVGQGLAGTLLANACKKAGKNVMVIDPGLKNSASYVAAGMFTPVSGKRMALTQEADLLLKTAISTYKEIELLLGTGFLHEQSIYHAFGSVKEQNDFASRLDDTNFSGYLNANPLPEPNINQPFGAFEVLQSGWLDTPLFLQSYRTYIQSHASLLEEEFDYGKLVIGNKEISYKSIQAKQIVFCEGYLVKRNPFFTHVEIIPCKGDVLTVACKGGPKNRIVKKGCYMVNTQLDQYRVGATYEWGNANIQPTESGKLLLESKLKDLLNLPFFIMQHQVGIRPTTKDRKPILEQHPLHSSLYIFNGLGTKGVLQGPERAKEMTSLLKLNR